MISTELAVLLVGGGLYLLDCVVLLARGQGILVKAGGGWRLLFGSRHYVIKGSPVALLNPLTPAKLALKTLPLFRPPAPGSLKPSKVVRVLWPVQPLALAQFCLVFLFVPVTMYRYPGWPFLVALSLSYLNVLSMLTLVALRFRAAGLPRRPLWTLGFNCIVCVPLSVNFYRRAALAIDMSGDAARLLRLVSTPKRGDARARLILELREAAQDAEEDSLVHGKLTCLAQRLATAEADERL